MRNTINALLISSVLFALAGCQSSSSKPTPVTLATNPKAPNDLIQMFYGGAQWNRIKDMQYDGFVVMRGIIADNRTIPNPRIVKSFPDDSRNERALEFAKEIRLTPVTVGGRVRGAGEIHVYFYETKIPPREALVIAKQQDTVGPTASAGGTFYLVTVSY
ncbi:hypothetical protein M2103_000785 [Ereboglobus sp. PH5-5]|uniref:hypothetical protein n=1 Tax=unclassified Ereboglobus TaxID=2626932 RepID=UPI0024059970|nr:MULTISPECIES: hypothetical protein [unclassified Ereboglobus]MDF9827157.1 hypothetical protein [Ereboglobus sp. PH5-10]MDF9832575.1 hypothetical protein [Ereboglobus sp. PH5-5]